MGLLRLVITAILIFCFGFSAARGSEAVQIVPLLSPDLPFLPKKNLEPHVADALVGYKAARARFVAGLPKGEHLFVSCRYRDALMFLGGKLNPSYFAVVKVTQISPDSEKIVGKIADIPGNDRIPSRDSVEVPETQIIDWKIVHDDGTIEGNVLGQYLALQGKKADIDLITEDQREADIRELGSSPLLGEALDESILQFFDDPALVFHRDSTRSNAADWPELTAKFNHQTKDAIYTLLSERARAVKSRQKVEIEKTEIGIEAHANPILLATFSLGFKKGDRPLVVRQIIQFDFNYRNEKLERAHWGFRTIEAIVAAPPQAAAK